MAAGDGLVELRAAVPAPAAGDAPPRSAPGFFGALTPEQRKAALDYDGPQDFGDPALKLP